MDSATFDVVVVDETAPALEDIVCAELGTMIPPDVPLTFQVDGEGGIVSSAADSCSEVTVTVSNFDCWMFNGAGKRVDKTQSCVVSFDSTSLTIEDSGGVGDNIGIEITVTDTSGNATVVNCGPITVLNPSGNTNGGEDKGGGNDEGNEGNGKGNGGGDGNKPGKGGKG